MNHRSTLTTLAIAAALGTLGFSPLAEAQRRRPRGPRAPAAMNARGPAVTHDGGSLGGRDRTDDAGRYVDARSVTLSRGDAVRFGVSSGDFDTVARVVSPDGETWEDDDGAGEGTDSLLRFTAPRDGRYEFVVTSYRPGEGGAFRSEIAVERGGSLGGDVAADAGDGDAAEGGEGEDVEAPEAPRAEGAGTTYGVFVGITRYGQENHDLPGSAADAQHLARAFEGAGWMRRSNAVVLTDGEATLDRVRQAFRSLAPRVGPRDMLVFFFDGHGNTSELDLRGDDLSRRELGRLLDGVRGRSLVVLDSCNAGGFAGVVRSNPRRAGLFSSRADEESSTAPQVGAGGWLAWHFRRAVEGGVRRRADGSVDFTEVVRYVEAGYRQHDVDHHLVAVNGARGGFAVGGAGGDAVGAEPPSDVAVARNDPPAAQPLPWAGNGNPLPSLDGDAMAQAVNLGVGLAGHVLEALTK